MIISEKQIIHLIYIATEYRRELLKFKADGILSEAGQTSLDGVINLLETVVNQQSAELKVIE